MVIIEIDIGIFYVMQMTCSGGVAAKLFLEYLEAELIVYLRI